MTLRFIIAALFGAVCAASSAHAQVQGDVIATYNEAVQSGEADATLRASVDLAEAAMANSQDERAALLAFEAGWKLCEYGRCGDAIAPADFALAQPAGDGHPVMADLALLAAYARWKHDPGRRTRRGLDRALDPLVSAEPSLVSVTVFTERMLDDIQSERLTRLIRTSKAAVIHLDPVRTQFGEPWALASFMAILAPYRRSAKVAQQREMAHLRGKLGEMRARFGGPDSPETPEWLEDGYWRSEAWLLAMEAYFNSVDESDALDAEALGAISALYERDVNEIVFQPEQETDAEEPLPLCEGSLDQPLTPRFPRNMAYKGLVGAVVIGFELDEGRITNAEVLAAVPEDGFSEEALNSLTDRVWTREKAQPAEPCTLSRKNLVQSFIFELG